MKFIDIGNVSIATNTGTYGCCIKTHTQDGAEVLEEARILSDREVHSGTEEYSYEVCKLYGNISRVP